MTRGAGVPHAAVHHARAGALRLLRVPFGPDLPYGRPTRSCAASRRWPPSASTASPVLPASAAVLRSALWRTASARSRCWSPACSCRRSSAGTYLAVGQLGEFYALSVVFGLAYGGVMPLYAILVREYFGEKIMGTVFGAVTMVASLGMALGPWAGGMVFDAFNSYVWLYIGSSSIGLAAVAIALAFPTIARKPRATGDGLKRMNKPRRHRSRRTRTGARAADRARGRRDRADAAADATGRRCADRQRPLSRAAAEIARRRGSAARELHADAGGGGEG